MREALGDDRQNFAWCARAADFTAGKAAFFIFWGGGKGLGISISIFSFFGAGWDGYCLCCIFFRDFCVFCFQGVE